MRKIVVLEHISLDGVIQAPGGPDEDRSGGFAYGGAREKSMSPRTTSMNRASSRSRQAPNRSSLEP